MKRNGDLSFLRGDIGIRIRMYNGKMINKRKNKT